MKSEIYVVVYRTGGWRNATWHATIPDSLEKTEERAKAVRRQGYKAFVWSKARADSLGLPVGFCVHADASTGVMEKKTCNCQ